ncbi:hypothetical protein EJ04DRAFT_298714 [Polyplosphaeria fusca]|uniref:Uncharacterized protein n=1 Tax=Polyplosphaeria fusca TaxID=682080 RepID=A0A9P4QXK8_9PLEO|nr:hypothetical protein EJ04DRAFT_298714 [Polyplosphaeria fusca]
MCSEQQKCSSRSSEFHTQTIHRSKRIPKKKKTSTGSQIEHNCCKAPAGAYLRTGSPGLPIQALIYACSSFPRCVSRIIPTGSQSDATRTWSPAALQICSPLWVTARHCQSDFASRHARSPIMRGELENHVTNCHVYCHTSHSLPVRSESSWLSEGRRQSCRDCLDICALKFSRDFPHADAQGQHFRHADIRD